MSRVITFRAVTTDDYELIEKIDRVAETLGISRSEIIRSALQEYITKYQRFYTKKTGYSVEYWVIR